MCAINLGPKVPLSKYIGNYLASLYSKLPDEKCHFSHPSLTKNYFTAHNLGMQSRNCQWHYIKYSYFVTQENLNCSSFSLTSECLKSTPQATHMTHCLHPALPPLYHPHFCQYSFRYRMCVNQKQGVFIYSQSEYMGTTRIHVYQRGVLTAYRNPWRIALTSSARPL